MLRRTLTTRAAAAKQLTAKVRPHVPFLLHAVEGKSLPPIPDEVSFDADKPMQWFEFMTRMRRMEQNADITYKMKLIKGFLHLYSGQEAIPTGMGELLEPGDDLITAYRCHVWHCLRGGTIEEVFAEMFGKATGCSKGKGGSMHMYKESHNFFGGNGIVGAQVPVGAGLAWAHAIKNGDKTPKNMAVTLYGDGAANQGQIFEAYNMAALWNLPCLFACENNKYGMGTAAARGSANAAFYKRCEYIPGIRCDGNDIFSVMACMTAARQYIIGGNGPLLVEFDTYRYSGHSMSDPGLSYRTPEEVKHMRATRDPILGLAHYMVEEAKIATSEELQKVTKRCNAEVDEILEKAKVAPVAAEAELYSDILTNPQNYPTHRIKTCQGTVFYPPQAAGH